MKLVKHCGYYLAITKRKSEWESYIDPKKTQTSNSALKKLYESVSDQADIDKENTW